MNTLHTPLFYHKFSFYSKTRAAEKPDRNIGNCYAKNEPAEDIARPMHTEIDTRESHGKYAENAEGVENNATETAEVVVENIHKKREENGGDRSVAGGKALPIGRKNRICRTANIKKGFQDIHCHRPAQKRGEEKKHVMPPPHNMHEKSDTKTDQNKMHRQVEKNCQNI